MPDAKYLKVENLQMRIDFSCQSFFCCFGVYVNLVVGGHGRLDFFHFLSCFYRGFEGLLRESGL